jgi:hypothetical protein
MKTLSNPTIPRLGATASEVFANALAYDTGGYVLKFTVVCDGEWQYNRATNKFEKCGTASIPVIERVESDAFDAWLISQIAKGFVTIWCGDKRNYWELHRATGRTMPK